MLLTARRVEPLLHPVSHGPLDDAVFALMAEAAVEAGVRLGVRDPWPVVRELERLCAPFEAPPAIDEARISVGARAQRDAALLTGTLWAAVRVGGGPRSVSGECRVFADVLDPQWLARLGTATGERQVDLHARHGWALLLSRWLGALSSSPLNVMCVQTTQDIEPVDAGPECWDAWYGVVVQLSGATVWRFGAEGLGEVIEVTTRPGDVVLVPDGLPYQTAVSPDAGRSRRMTLTLRRRELPDR